jgi:hypothetical protein
MYVSGNLNLQQIQVPQLLLFKNHQFYLTFSAHVTDSKQWKTPADARHGIHTNGPLVGYINSTKIILYLLVTAFPH